MGATHGSTGDTRQDELRPMAERDAGRAVAGQDDVGARHQSDIGTATARRSRARWLRGTAVLLITGGLSLGSVGALAQLTAVPDDRPGYLQLTAEPYPTGVTELAPGQSVSWHLQARLEDADGSTLGLELRGTGALVEHLHGMEVAVESCPSAFVGEGCPGGGSTVVPRARLAEVAGAPTGPTWWLPDLVPAEPQHLRVELGLPGEGGADATLQELAGAVTVGLHASGSDPATETPGAPETPQPPDAPDEPATASPGAPASPGGGLPPTGAAVTGLLLTAAGLLLLGATLRRAAGVRAPR
ncbi:hypothetical protein PU560_14290 [Georgenia sp. 10Sc9-8]|uniref:LPXTG cell wall anchor domain-containing protein n=1 Tax=Georgenia halotolerans TaxID=3028317 RepID=A0ABT5TZX5_9MICO|nr:hypothetical protein [Georgenia halotolerans]